MELGGTTHQVGLMHQQGTTHHAHQVSSIKNIHHVTQITETSTDLLSEILHIFS